MLCKCKACGWRGDLPDATKPGAKLKSRNCPACKAPGHLARLAIGARRNIDAIRSRVLRKINEAAGTGQLDGEPLAPHTLLEQMAGLEPGATAAAASPAQSPETLHLAYMRRAVRSAEISARATKRELRRIAASTAALAEVSRVCVDTLAEVKGALSQIYAGFDCCVRLLVELRDGKSPRGMKALRDYLEPEQEPAFSLGRSLVADRPTAGAVLRMKGGDTWKVLRAEGDEISVLISPALDGPTREVTVARRNWAVLCNEAESASPAVVGEGEQKPVEPERDFTNAHTLDCGPGITTRERVATNPRRGDVLTTGNGTVRRVVTSIHKNAVNFKYEYHAGDTGFSATTHADWAALARDPHTEVTPSPLAGDETEAEADAILAQKPEGVKA